MTTRRTFLSCMVAAATAAVTGVQAIAGLRRASNGVLKFKQYSRAGQAVNRRIIIVSAGSAETMHKWIDVLRDSVWPVSKRQDATPAAIREYVDAYARYHRSVMRRPDSGEYEMLWYKDFLLQLSRDAGCEWQSIAAANGLTLTDDGTGIIELLKSRRGGNVLVTKTVVAASRN